MKTALAVVLSVAALTGGPPVAVADSTPVGPLPAGPVTSIESPRGELVALALPQRGAGRVWRIARPLDAKVLREISEANVGSRSCSSSARAVAVARPSPWR
jgi:hypothetical protein